MKVLLIYLGRKGGGSIYSLEMAKALSKRCEIVAMISKQSEVLENWRKIGIPLIEIDTYKNIVGVFLSFFNIRRFVYLWKKIRELSPDVVYYPMIHIWTPIINFGIPSIPKVTTIHDPVMHKGERNILLEFIQKIAIKQSNLVILLSKVFIPVLERFGFPKEMISIIPHGEFSYYAYYKPENVKRENNLILFFGRIREYKGLEVLLEAFPLIKDKVKDARLLIVGEGDITPYKAKLSELQDVEIINHWISDEKIAQLFSQANLLVLPYTDATQSGIIPIAYVFKVPVVSTKVGGIPEQIEDGRTGILVEPGDHEKLAEACVRILTDPLLADTLVENGYRKALEEWNWERISEMLVREFERLVFKKN